MAPGPVLGRFWPNGGYVARDDWAARNPGLAGKFRTAINKSLAYAQAHPEEIRDLLPAAPRNVRLPIWSSVSTASSCSQLAKYAKEFGVISTLPNMTKLFPSTITGGKALQGAVGDNFILLRLDGKAVTRLKAGKYTIVIADSSKTQNFSLVGPGVNKATSRTGTGRSTCARSSRKVCTRSARARVLRSRRPSGSRSPPDT